MRAQVAETSPMIGLQRRAVGFVDVLAQSVGATAPTAAAATIPAMVAGQTGGSVLGCLVLAWILVGLVGVVLGEFSRRMRAPGSLYTFAVKGLGARAGFAAAAAQITGYAFVSMFCLVGGALYVQSLLARAFGLHPSRPITCIIVVVLGAACFAVLRHGLRLSARVTLVVEVVAIVVLVGAMGVVLTRSGSAGLLTPWRHPFGPVRTLVPGTAVATTAFVGFESAAALGRETRRPFLTIPRTLRWTVLGVGLAYVFSAWAQQVGVRAFAVPLADNDLVVPSLALHSGIPGMSWLLEAGLGTSFVACAIASLTALSRVVFTLGREGLLPRCLGAVDAMRGTPVGALTAVVPVTVAVPLVMVACSPGMATAMKALIAVAALGYLSSYVLATAAAPVFLRRVGELTRVTLVVPWATAVVLAIVVAAYAVVVAREDLMAFVIVLVIAALTAALRSVAGRRRPDAVATMGMFDETTVGEVFSGSSSGAA